MIHSSIVGGSTAKRVMRCPASVKLAREAPASPSSDYAREGTLLHEIMAQIYGASKAPEALLGVTLDGVEFTQELLDEKIRPAMKLLDTIQGDMDLLVEQKVDFGGGIFGSCDLLGRVDDRLYVIDWKFGSGVAVDAEDNPQLLFYAAAALHSAKKFVEGVREVELVIIQPPGISRWITTLDRVRLFERELFFALELAAREAPPMAAGDWCRWCPAKPTCPAHTQVAERALRTAIDGTDVRLLGEWLNKADLIEDWLKALRAQAAQIAEVRAIPGWKLVPKRGIRKWVDEDVVADTLSRVIAHGELFETSLLSPAQMEKKLKKVGQVLPAGLAVSVSSGTTLVPDSDPREPALLIGSSLVQALSKL